MLLHMTGFSSFCWLDIHTYYIFLTHLSTSEDLHCLAIINNAAMNIGLHIFFQVDILFPSDKHPEVKLMNHMTV